MALKEAVDPDCVFVSPSWDYLINSFSLSFTASGRRGGGVCMSEVSLNDNSKLLKEQ